MDSNFSLNSLLELVLTIGRSANHNDTRTNSTYRIKNTNAIPVADETIAQANAYANVGSLATHNNTAL
jgi:hypothetical protein